MCIDNRQPMTALRRAHHLCRLALLWFVLSLGVAVASPMVNPQAMELVCSTVGSIKIIVQTDEGAQALGASQMDCPLCVPGGAPPPTAMAMAADLPNFLPLSHAVQPTVAARIAAATAVPPPARGPPRFS